MAASLSLHNSHLVPDSLSAEVDVSKGPHEGAESDVEGVMTELRAKLQAVQFDGGAFLNQVTDHTRQLAQADSTVVALRQGGRIVCVARSGSLGPALGTPMDSPSGISGECLRQGLALKCADSQTDSRVDAEVCRRLGIRSVLVVPVIDRSEVIGLLEAFSSRADAFQDWHVPILQKLASLIAESRVRRGEDASPSLEQNSALSLKPVVPFPSVPVTTPREERQSTWIEASRLRPYQIAIVIVFLLLDLAILYWWPRR